MQTTLDITPDMLATPDVIADPYPAYRALRDASPMRFVRMPAGVLPGVDEPVHAWALLRYADVARVLRDHETFSSDTPGVSKAMPKLMVLHDDPPRHTQRRRLVSAAFTPKRVAEMEPFIKGVTKELLDAIGEGATEIMSSLAIPLPMKVIAEMLGMPSEDYATYRRWSEAMLGYTGVPADERARNMREMAAAFREVVAARRERGEADMISALIQAEVDGETLTDPEVASACTLMLLAGNETTTSLIGNILHILASRPDLWARARADRSLVDRIIDETLRYASPVQRLMRLVMKPVEIAGVPIPAGDLVDVFYGAANRDPAVFEDADVFNVDRAPAENMAFGMGVHSCFGPPLARLEVRILLNELLDRFPSIALTDEPAVRQRTTIVALCFQSLPLALRAGTAA